MLLLFDLVSMINASSISSLTTDGLPPYDSFRLLLSNEPALLHHHAYFWFSMMQNMSIMCKEYLPVLSKITRLAASLICEITSALFILEVSCAISPVTSSYCWVSIYIISVGSACKRFFSKCILKQLLQNRKI